MNLVQGSHLDLTEEYWRSFALTAEELDYLHQLILDAGIPQTAAFLAYDLVERRCEQEQACVEEEAVEVLPYDPRQEYKVGQEIVVKIQRKHEMVYLQGTVTGKRNVWQANYGNFEAIRVRFGEGKKATSKEYMASVKRGFDDWKPIPMEQVIGEDWDLGQTDEYIAPGEVLEQFQGYVLRQLTEQLGADARFIGFGHEWFVPELLASVSEDELAAAARRIEQTGDPFPLHRLARVPEMPQRNEDFARQFSWNYALSHDPRFDNVGTADTPLWFLRALEPPEAVERPSRLAIPAVPPTYQYVHRELKDMERLIDDEGSEDEAPPPVTAERVPSVEFVLSFAHRATGTIPLTSRIRRAFPQADGPRTRISFIDGRSGERMPGWVMHEDRYAWGLREWYDENLIWAGAYIRLETTENPLEMVVDYIPLPQPKEERVRVARVVDGQLTFEWQTRTIPYKYDSLMLIAETRFEDMEALWLEAEKVRKPIFEVLCDVFPALARLHSQGHIHARTLYSAVNLVRRCAPGTVFGTLSARPCFDSVGDGYWTYDPDLRDVKVVYRTEKEVERREKRGAWYDEAKRKAAARKAAETRREREADLPPEERAGYKAARTRERRQQFWGMLGGLVGQELYTLHGHNPFTVDEVRERQVKITVGTTGNRRTIQRKEIEPAWERLVEEGSVSLAEIKRQFSDFNPAYVTAIFAVLPGVTYRTKPLRLFYGQEAEAEAALETLQAEEAPEVLEAASEGRPPAPPTETTEPPTAEEVPISEPASEEPAPPPPEPPAIPTEPAELPTAEEVTVPEFTPEEPTPTPLGPPALLPPPPSGPPPVPPAPAPRPRAGGAKSLFSDHYLRHRLPDHTEWSDDVGEPLAALRALHEEKQGILPNLNEAQTEAEFIRPALEVLGFAYIPQTSARHAGRALRPDYALFADEIAKEEAYSLLRNEPAFYARALAVADAKYWGRPLSETRRDDARDEFRNTNPSFQIVNYLIGTGVDWGILTNGRTWRLYYRQASSTAHEFYEVDLVEALADEDVFKRFWLFFRRDAFTPDPQGNTFLDRVRMGSDTYARVIGDRLKGLVFGEVFPLLAGGFVAYRHTELGEDATSETARQEIYQATLSLLYKLLFLLYAEARDLLPVANTGYQQKSITRMAREIARRMDRQEPLGTTSTGLYDRLLDLFRVIDRGDRGLTLPRYNGGLFSARNRANQFLARHKLADAVLAPALDKLARADGEPIDYGFIGVRHLGAIYEGLLEHQLVVEQPEETSEISQDFGSLVHLETDKGKRKATGSYYTPDYIVKYIVAHTLGPLVEERAARFDQLMERIKAVRDELARNPAAVPAGRQELDRLEHQARETLLDIKVCDPATGSGHFLVEAVDFLTDRLIDILNQFPEHNPVLSMLDRIRASIVAEMERQGIAVDARRLDDTQLLTRVVMKRCIYGVDLNEMAVELAKVSLWLHTFTVGAPLSFLDHHLRWGNSLIGAMARDVDREMQETSAGQLHLFAGPFRGLLQQAEVMRGISVLSDATFAELEKSETLFQQFDTAAKPYKKLLDVYVAQHFGVEQADDFLRLYGAEVMEADPDLVGEPYTTVVREARQLYEEKRFFHWDLEFPEVFIDLEKADWKEDAGFDAVVGNPPYVRQEGLGEDKPLFQTTYKAYHGTADLYVYFIERGMTLLRRNGQFGMITSNKFIRTNYGAALRRYLARDMHVKQIVDFAQLPVFPGITVRTAVLLVEKTPSDGRVAVFAPVRTLDFTSLDDEVAEVGKILPAGAFESETWLLTSVAETAVLEKMKNGSQPLSKYVDGEIRFGIKTGFNEAFVIDAETREQLVEDDPNSAEIIKPVLVGSDVDRYETSFDEQYLIWTDIGVDLSRYPAIAQHLSQFRDQLERRWDKGDQWYELRPCTYYNDFEKPKIIYPDIAAACRFAYDDSGFFSTNTIYFIPRQDLYLLPVLNSSLSYFYFKTHCAALEDAKRRAWLRFFGQYMELLSVRRIAFTTPPDERAQLVGVGITEATEFIEHTEGAASVPFSAFSASVFGRWLDERLSPTHTPDPVLVRKHNAEPLNEDHQLPEAGPVEQSDVVHDLLAHLAAQMMAMNKDKQAEAKGFLSWLETFLGCPVDDLSGKTYVRAYHKRTFDQLLATLKKNRRRIQPDLDRRGPLEALRAEWETSMGKLRPLLARIAATDRLIDLIVYRLYGLTEDEVAVVEGAAP